MATPKHTGGIDLEGAAELWPTPAASEVRQGYQNRHNGMKGTQESLTTVALDSFLPDQQTEGIGQPCSENGQTSPRRLNPKFVEWLQGLPEGWTSADRINSEALEIWFVRSRELLRSLCC